MNFAYLIPRIIRHFMPEHLADWMKKRQFIIKAGIETMDPQAAVDRYVHYFHKARITLEKKRIMIFGYGGNILIGCEFLRRGATQVVLCERKNLPFPKLTMNFVDQYPHFFIVENNEIRPNPQYLQIVHEDIRLLADQQKIEQVDLVLSTSVYEHLDDVENITRALAALTSNQGKQIHFIDLRDHFFKYPFEMLTYSERTWKSFLNPTSNLNRFRIPQYDSIFHKYFSTVKISITESNMDSFQKTKPRIQGGFLSGDDEIDSATRIIVEVKI